eukprot:m.1038508 g.1038508  ORF g.1038508 m.1038508 type:complete len:115 (+) comp24148_c0_seq27:1221-1565(+)
MYPLRVTTHCANRLLAQIYLTVRHSHAQMDLPPRSVDYITQRVRPRTQDGVDGWADADVDADAWEAYERSGWAVPSAEFIKRTHQRCGSALCSVACRAASTLPGSRMEQARLLV